jgi:hypothetical protein
MKRALCGLLLLSFAARAVEPAPPAWQPSAGGAFSQRVRLLGDDDRVELWRIDPDGYTVVCKTPCSAMVQVRPMDQFMLVGRGIVPSAVFHLEPRDGDLKLKVSVRDPGPRIFGMVLGGAGLVVAGISGLAYALNTDAFCDEDQQCHDRHASEKSTAGTVALTSLVVAAVGVVIAVVASPHTRFTVEE